jgi:hypothetical protein
MLGTDVLALYEIYVLEEFPLWHSEPPPHGSAASHDGSRQECPYIPPGA